MKQLTLILATAIVGMGFLSFNDDNNQAEVGLEIGNKAPIFQTQQTDGTNFNLKNVEGKMVILSFWASYDSQSRMNNYRLTQLKNEFENSSFHNGQSISVVSISLDRFKSPLRSAITEDEIQDFIHICDFQGKKGSIAQQYQIQAPINILIDGHGRILAKDRKLSKIEKSLIFLAAI